MLILGLRENNEGERGKSLFVYDAKGRPKTRVIFGFDVDSYTFKAGEDYTLDTRGTCTLTPIE